MKYFFANWKMYLNAEESGSLATQLSRESFDAEKVNIAIFPNTLFILDARRTFDKTPIHVGAQNVNWVPMGAYTGAVSALLFAKVGCTHALVGHSERRYIFGEKDEDVRKKTEACFDAGISPVICIGETEEDRDSGRTEYRIKKQLMKVFEGLDVAGHSPVVAYEPVWAISAGGSGEPCKPEEAERMILFIKEEIKTYTDAVISVLYGGSVKPDNVLSYVSLDLIDGVLAGHASTKFDDFVAMVRAVEGA
jgi:triosephosphate isomerase